MSAFIRIYTQLGKENICAVEAFALDYSDPVYTLKLYDINKDKVNCIKEIIKEGGPCNIHIRHEDQGIEVECKLEGCTIEPRMYAVQYDRSTLTYKEIKS